MVYENHIAKKETIMFQTYFNLRTEIGFVLAIVGVQFSAILREFIPSINLTNAVMALSILLVIDLNNFSRLRFPSISCSMGLLILMQLYMLFVTYACGVQRYFFNQGYVIAFILALATIEPYKIFRHFEKIVFWVTMVIAIVIVYQGTFGFTVMSLQSEAFYRGGYATLEQGGDKITLGRALGLGIISALYYEGKNENILRILLIMLAFAGLLLFNTRAACFMGGIFIMIKTFYYDNRNVNQGHYKKAFAIFLGIIVAVLFGKYFLIMGESIVNAIETLFVGHTSNGADPSTINRFYTISKVLQSFENANLLELIFGQGYVFYVDIPLLQAFHDFGLIGGCLYFYLLVILPILFIVMWKDEKKQIHILQLFALQYVIDQIYCAEPYQFYHFMPLILLCFYERNQQKPILGVKRL